MRNRSTLMASAIAIAGATSAIQVQADAVELDEIVVSATGHKQEILQAPASIGVISRSDIENRSYRDVTDVIEDLPGIVVSGGGSRKDITIRGLPAQYTLLMVDGRKVSGRESQPNGSSGLEQGWLPPLETIEYRGYPGPYVDSVRL
ncbi:TonB-dependent receptor plug domain-containing protein [Marinobacter sp. HL-58]|uniref:TonB-dependent receptor plug domain-containing protein n=1 Tax=Marinobacter sp. HL-58 TaxID=1479237 RepID=UPI000AD7E792|nr:TonB-dependent receptor plug domain-containing protein [Marinobacter sp. HL-58]